MYALYCKIVHVYKKSINNSQPTSELHDVKVTSSTVNAEIVEFYS